MYSFVIDGDIGFFLAILWLYSRAGTLLFYDGGNGCLEQSSLNRLVAQTASAGIAVSTGISLLILCGASLPGPQVGPVRRIECLALMVEER